MLPTLFRLAMLGLLLWGGAGAWAGAQPDGLSLLSDGTPRVEIWDQATALDDPSGALGLADVRAHEAEFRPLTGPRANLGRRAGAVWLRIPVQVADDSKGHWVLQIDYALAPQDGDTATALLQQADAAMYAGKQDGRRCLRRGRAMVGSV